jgi:hypothetical protein
MAIVGNTLSEIGDILYVNVQLAILGNADITSFNDDLVGETTDRFFIKSFRYSLDSINFSDWQVLNVNNLQQINGFIQSLLFMEFRYERGGSDTSGVLEFKGINISGNILVQICNNSSTIDTIFEQIACNNSLTKFTSNNLLKKIYKSGILPNFIERGEGVDDKDFISLWGSVCFFLAMISSFADEFDNILYRRKLLVEHLKSLNIMFSQTETKFEDLQYISKNFLDEIRKRGTSQIYKNKGTELLDSTETPIDGELLRLINKKPKDEFIFESVRLEHNGHFLDKSSFLYNGNYSSMMINKSEENTEDFEDLSLYELQNDSNISIIQDGSLKCAKLVGSSGELVGIGFNKDNPPNIADTSKLSVIDKNVDYEITFMIKRISGSAVIHFGVHGFNENGVFKNLSFQKIDNFTTSRIFFSDTNNSITKIQNNWYFVRGIVYSQRTKMLNNKFSKTNVIGSNLRFNNNEDVNFIKPFILISGDEEFDEILIHNYKIRPLIRGKNINDRNDGIKSFVKNPQFIQSSNTIINHYKNNSDFDDDYVLNFIQNFLITYRNNFCNINL